MPGRRKIDFAKIRADQFITCTACHAQLEYGPELYRIDGKHYRCPKCGAAFEPESKANKGLNEIGFH